MSKILVTGGAGFIGSHIIEELIRQGHNVIAIDDLSRGFKENVPPKANLIIGNVEDYNLVLKTFKEHKFDYVFHLAAQSAMGLSNFIKRFNYKNNLIGSINLINASILNEIKCFVFISSVAVYGDNSPPYDEENTIPNPQDPYGISKYAIELELKSSKKVFDLNYIIFRPYNVYGERQNIGDKYRNVLGIFMRQVMEKKPITIVGDGEQKLAFTHISDIAQVISKSPFVEKAYNNIFNVGSDKLSNMKELAEEVAKSLNTDIEIKYIPKRTETRDAYSKIDKAKKVFSWEPKISLQDGVKRMADWAKAAGIKRIEKFEEIEIKKNIPSAWLEKYK